VLLTWISILHPRTSIFQILFLDYIVALYPFFLIFMTYVLVTAYDKWYRLVYSDRTGEEK
jgi:hypothetical protein